MEKVEQQPIKQKIVKKKHLEADDYQRLSQKEHIYKISDTYIGSDAKEQRDELVFNFAKGQMVKKNISLPAGIERIFLEVLTNAGDNVFKSRLALVDPKIIDITLSDKIITVRNYGTPIPIEINKKENVYIPEMIFGMLLTSSNYDTNYVRLAAGRNGIGIKLCNIFSKNFRIDIGDNIRGLQYIQEWKNNMDDKTEPIIKKYKGDNYVEISYLLDFERFGYENYPAEAFALFGRLALEISMTCKIPITINGTEYDCSDIRKYASLCFPSESDELIKKSIVYEYTKDNVVIELCVLDTPDNGEMLSYVNGIITREGGVHVNAALKALSKEIIPMISDGKKGKDKDGKDKKEKKTNLKISDIAQHISMLLCCRIPDPKFSSQSKTKLSSPEINFTIPEKIFVPVKKWKLIDRLYMTIEIKQFNALKDTDGKKKRHISNLKGEDANNAGTNKSGNCTLYIVEGKSAMGYAVKAISTIPNGRDHHGILPIKGKLLNVMNATPQQIAENEELKEIKKMLGLREGLDYTNEENFSTLRYGYLVILTDADDDGKHITGLILNFFFCRFPSLLARGYLFYLKTPILRVSHGSENHKFYTQKQYDLWKEKVPNFSSYTHRYYKGLGTSKDSDIKDDFKEPKIIMCVYDDTTTDALRLAFDVKLANDRKKWIGSWKNNFEIQDVKYTAISTFINTEFIQYSVTNLHRSIPRFMDGLKISQRKVLWAAFLQWKSGKIGNIMRSPKELKVAQFANLAAEKTNYHHGEMCLAETIINMAQDFVGANNMAYFTQDGQFGTRNLGGADAAQPRYPYTRPMEWLSYIFRQEDFPLLEYVEDEGQNCEPITFLPIIPMCLINGCLGIGTGHSTFVPNCSPMEIITWLINKIQGFENKEVLPWYRGFKGDIKVRIADINNDELVDEDQPSTPTMEKTIAMVTTGKYRINSKGDVVISEIPIGVWINKYKQFLEKIRDDKLISTFRNLSKDNEPKFEVITEKKPSMKTLKLIRTFGLTNMVLLDINNNPKKFKSIEMILEEFYKIRLPYYYKRKQQQIDDITKIIKNLENKHKFISYIIDEKIIVYKKKKIEIQDQMKKYDIPEELLSNLRVSALTEDELNDLEKQIKQNKDINKKLEDTTPEQMWLNDLYEFQEKYIQMYGNELEIIEQSQKRVKQDKPDDEDITPIL
jgi:DNA topoisomerase-2